MNLRDFLFRRLRGKPVQYTPSVTALSGSVTAADASATYQRIGKQVFLHGSVVVSDHGTGAGALLVSLPSDLCARIQSVGSCAQFAAGGAAKAMQVTLCAPLEQFPFSYTAVSITSPEGTFPTESGSIHFSIVYEASGAHSEGPGAVTSLNATQDDA